MAILSIFFKDKKGGYTKRLYRLYKSIMVNGQNVHFIGAAKIPLQHEKLFQHIIKVPFLKKENILFWSSFIFQSFFISYKIVKKYKIDRIITFAPFYTLLCIIPSYLYRLPTVTFIRFDNMQHSTVTIRNIFFYVIEWMGIKISKRIIFVSEHLKNVYLSRYKIPKQKVQILPNNIEKRSQIDIFDKTRIRESIGILSGEFLISTSGVFNAGKNFSLIIKVMEQLCKDKIRAVIIGDEVVPTGERRRLEKLTQKLSLEKHVIFCGWQTDPTPLVASSDLFVFPSKYEGSPNALLEALGCGVPCYGSNIEEVSEILSYNELLFSPDDPDNLVERIRYIRSNADAYDHVTTLSRERCEKYIFDWEAEVVKLSS
jgi:glycosyltransferase involved in cell wall biosynthesis